MLCCGRPNSNNFFCEVVLLDDTILPFRNNINFKKNDKAQIIFDVVCDHLNLIERDYFGLRYQDQNFQTHWLDLFRALREHEGLLREENPQKLYFGVKYFIADPTNLKEEITRYQVFLQLKQEILLGRLPCDFKKATELSALSLQSELGDYQESENPSGYASEFRFVPNQDEEFEYEVERLHKEYTGLLPSEAETIYLRKCRQLDMYGLDVHAVHNEEGVDYLIGLSAKGMEFWKNQRKVRMYYWPTILHIEFKGRQLNIRIKTKHFEDTSCTYISDTRSACKYLWKRAIEHHAFFRLVQSNNISSSTTFLGNKFRYSGRTESEMLLAQSKRKEPVVLRSRSKRYPSRNKKTKSNGNEITKNKATDRDVDDVQHTEDNNSQIPSPYFKNQLHIEQDKILERSGLFGTSQPGGISKNYVTPKSERRQRNYQLQSLSDVEKKPRKSRSRLGRSSGEESDSPSKRRVRAHHNRRERSDTETSRHRHHYHTDTEMIENSRTTRRRNNENGDYSGGEFRKQYSEKGTGDDAGSDTTRSNYSRHRRTRKKHNRLSREDVHAQQVLWQHFQKEPEDPLKYSEQELQDIPYTAVKTAGNPLPIKLRRHSRGSNSPSYRRASSSFSETNRQKSSASQLGDGLVSPLHVTTTVKRDKVAVGTNYSNKPLQYSGPKQRSNQYPGNANDWDTKNKLGASNDNRRYVPSSKQQEGNKYRSPINKKRHAQPADRKAGSTQV